MQTFLPYKEFEQSADVLDYRRLGKQRVEAFQINNVLNAVERGETVAWMHHPAVLMWRGHQNLLAAYYNIILGEWIRRGYNNTMKFMEVDPGMPGELPIWLGDPRLHASHRSNLLRKDPVYYSKFGWKEPPDLPYYWPVRKPS